MNLNRKLIGLALAASIFILSSSGAVISPFAKSIKLSRLEPTAGTYFGVNLDWVSDSPSAFNKRLGLKAAVFMDFFQFPLGTNDIKNMDGDVQKVSATGGMLVITLEPFAGLGSVTEDACNKLSEFLASYNARGVSTFIRFAHEMNGSWYPWSQQPVEYISAFRLLADSINRKAPQAAMMWAPNYGGGYPFKGGKYEAKPGSTDFGSLDTNHDGKLGMNDDPYSPYYPGDEYVDWVGMSLYHWGNAYPWGENEIPEAGKFFAQLTGNYSGLNGDDRSVPDFYATYYVQHGKPIAIPETAAFFDPAKGGPDELILKQFWWRQVYDPALLAGFPGIKMINWFEHAKNESEVGDAWIDWRVTGSSSIVDKYRADLPISQLIFAP
jgi:hypothetical protein